MPIQIPNHAHCVICHRAIEYGEKTCSPEHQTQLEDIEKRRKRSMYLMYALMALAFVVLALSSAGVLG